MDKPASQRVLLVIIAVLIGIIVALVAGILAALNGGNTVVAISSGGISFAGTVPLVLVVMNALRLL